MPPKNPPKSPQIDKHKELIKFLSDATSRPFGMVLFYTEKGAPEDVVAGHIYKYEEADEMSMMLVGASHVLYQVADTYDAEELSELLLERGVMTYMAETEGKA